VRIDPGTVVTLEYEIRDCDGEALEREGAQLAYLHGGFGEIFPKVEEALEGKQPGDEVNLTLEPEDAFGEYDAELLRVEPRERFPEAIEVGMQFEGVPGDAKEALIYRHRRHKGQRGGRRQPSLAGERIWFAARASTARELRGSLRGHALVDAGLRRSELGPAQGVRSTTQTRIPLDRLSFGHPSPRRRRQHRGGFKEQGQDRSAGKARETGPSSEAWSKRPGTGDLGDTKQDVKVLKTDMRGRRKARRRVAADSPEDPVSNACCTLMRCCSAQLE
jgi:FKBP-type peptidyl-prolyl cis-trans isomerase SlyD